MARTPLGLWTFVLDMGRQHCNETKWMAQQSEARNLIRNLRTTVSNYNRFLKKMSFESNKHTHRTENADMSNKPGVLNMFISYRTPLTHRSPMSKKMKLGKQYRPRSDADESRSTLFALYKYQ